jgi:hypothetical protein
VARIIAKMFAALGVLRKGQLIEVDRSALVAGYSGQTAIKTKEARARETACPKLTRLIFFLYATMLSVWEPVRAGC